MAVTSITIHNLVDEYGHLAVRNVDALYLRAVFPNIDPSLLSPGSFFDLALMALEADGLDTEFAKVDEVYED